MPSGLQRQKHLNAYVALLCVVALRLQRTHLIDLPWTAAADAPINGSTVCGGAHCERASWWLVSARELQAASPT